VRGHTLDAKFTRGELVAEAALVLRLVVRSGVADHQFVNCALHHNLVFLTVRLEHVAVLLPRQLHVILGHCARQRHFLTDQNVRVLQAVDELERQSCSAMQ